MGTTTANHTADQATVDQLRARLEAAGADVETKRDAYRAALELRDRLIVQGIDAGMTTVEVGRAAGLHQSSVMRVLAKPA